MTEILEYKCPSCGGAIKFDSQAQKMKCPFCDTEFEMETLKAYDDVLKEDKPDKMNWDKSSKDDWGQDAEDLNVYGCKSCGGEIVVEHTTSATACPFCDNPVVLTGRVGGTLRPNYIIPFKLDKKDAVDRFNKHLQGKKLLPKVFKDKNKIEEIKGLYVPFWLFDAKADGNMRYRATRVTAYSDSQYNYVKTDHFMVTRKGDAAFAKVPVDGSVKMDDDLMESIEPYNFNDAVDFQTAYLAGYLADKYDVTEEKSVDRANERIKRSIEESFMSTVEGYSTVVPESNNVSLKDGSAQYALYPVWVLNTNWEGKKYTFAMNGQTGKFVGDLPMDKKIYWKYFLSYTGIAALVIYVLAVLLG